MAPEYVIHILHFKPVSKTCFCTLDKAIKDTAGNALKALPSYITTLKLDHLEWSANGQKVVAIDRNTKEERDLTERAPIVGKKRKRAQMSESQSNPFEDEDEDYSNFSNRKEINTPSASMYYTV